MDLLYSRYASPMEFMRSYMEQGRFGEFVANILEMDRKRKEETMQKENDDRLWLAYLHSMTDKSYKDWKKEVMDQGKTESAVLSMSNEQIEAAKQQVRGMLKNFSPG